MIPLLVLFCEQPASCLMLLRLLLKVNLDLDLCLLLLGLLLKMNFDLDLLVLAVLLLKMNLDEIFSDLIENRSNSKSCQRCRFSLFLSQVA